MVTPSQKVASVISNSHVYGEAACLNCPNSRKKASKRPPGRRRPKSGQFSQQLTYVLESTFCEGHQFPKKGFQKAPGCPKPKSGQFYHQLTYWKPLFWGPHVVGGNEHPKLYRRIVEIYVCMYVSNIEMAYASSKTTHASVNNSNCVVRQRNWTISVSDPLSAELGRGRISQVCM